MADLTYLEWPFLDAEHRALAADLKSFAADSIAPLGEPDHEHDAIDAHCRELVRRLGDGGWLRYTVPQEAGGRFVFSVRSLCLAREILGYVSGLADFAFAMQGLGSGPISLYGSERQRKKYLPAVASGKAIAAFAISEPDAGSDVGAMTTSARKDGNGYLLNGIKTWISNAGIADQYTVFARTGDAPGAKGLSAFIVEADTPGLLVSERITVNAPHPLGTLKFDNCRVPAEQMLGQPGEGFKVAMGTLDVFRSTVGAAALGFARRALDEALRRIRKRQVFGKPLSDYQLTQARIADMAVSIDAAALLIYRAAWTKDRDLRGRVTREASMAKLFATDQAQLVIDQAVQLFGGLGVVAGNTVENLYREIRSLRIYEGTSEIQKLIIAGEVMKAGADVT
jgi:acyl-CoA dehydrogenase